MLYAKACDGGVEIATDLRLCAAERSRTSRGVRRSQREEPRSLFDPLLFISESSSVGDVRRLATHSINITAEDPAGALCLHGSAQRAAPKPLTHRGRCG